MDWVPANKNWVKKYTTPMLDIIFHFACRLNCFLQDAEIFLRL
jgi:hypothetical protein